MLYFHGNRKPNFKNLENFDYNIYWENLCSKLRKNLRERESIFINLIEKKSKVLDIACGMSPFLIRLKKRKECDVVAYDISKKVIKEQEKYGIKGEVHDIDDFNFELKDNFDYIILSEIIEHLAYPERLISKIKYKTKYLIISLPNSAFYRYRLGLLFKGRFFTQWVHHPSEHLRFWSYIDFIDWLEAMNLEIVESIASNGLSIGPIKLFNLWKNLFGHQIVYLLKNKK